jgi:hypothetical protein
MLILSSATKKIEEGQPSEEKMAAIYCPFLSGYVNIVFFVYVPGRHNKNSLTLQSSEYTEL